MGAAVTMLLGAIRAQLLASAVKVGLSRTPGSQTQMAANERLGHVIPLDQSEAQDSNGSKGGLCSVKVCSS